MLRAEPKSVTALADRTLRDMGPVLDRYRPVALAVAAILVAVTVLPGATGVDPLASASFDDAASRAPESEVATGPPPTTGAPEAAADPSGIPVPSPTRSPSARRPVVVPPSPAPGDRGAAGGSSASPSPLPPTTVRPDAGAEGASGPLRIVDFAWASSTGGTPLPTGVPEGSLPVGTRIGQTDKSTYLRLAGEGSTLVLTEIADGRRGAGFEAPPVQACQITEVAWEGGENLPSSEAPPFDPGTCVPVSLLDDGTWTVALAAFPSPTDDRGIALVPSPDAPVDFQVTFAAQAAG